MRRILCALGIHRPSHQIDLGRDKATKIGFGSIYFSDPIAVCECCNAQLKWKEGFNRLPMVEAA